MSSEECSSEPSWNFVCKVSLILSAKNQRNPLAKFPVFPLVETKAELRELTIPTN